MGKIRILIVDEDVVVRRLLANVLSGDAAIEVAGTAPNARIALAKIAQGSLDLAVLNADMPNMDGQETWSAIRKTYPVLPVIWFSKLMHRVPEGAGNGQNLMARMEDSESLAAAIQRVGQELIPKIKRCQSRTPQPESATVAMAPSSAGLGRSADSAFRLPQRIEIVAIGASTGGPNALAVLLSAFPADCPVPVVIVQHMPPVFTGFLAERLASRVKIGISEGIQNASLHAGHAWIAPGDYHMAVIQAGERVRLQVHQAPPENSCRPSVDVLFRSVAEAYEGSALAVVLSGMGQDGLRGCERIREAGGQVLVQDEPTSIVWGMPGFVARAGLADQVLPLEQLGPEILRLLHRGRSLSFHG